MKALLSCEFNMDTDCIELKYSGGSIISINCSAVEEDLRTWADQIPAEVDEFWAVDDIIDIFGEQLSGFLILGEKPPNNYQFAVQGICDAIKDMPHCIFDVMRGRCIFSITHDTMEENGELWRYGIKSSRLIEKINEISANIREKRDYGYQ